MDRELWRQLSHAMADVARRFPANSRDTYTTQAIVRVYLWAVLHDRPVDWATRPRNWPTSHRPEQLPDQSTMSRRLRRPDTQEFLNKLGRRVSGRHCPTWVSIIDGKPLVIPKHSTDPDAAFGRGVGGPAKGYKLHAIVGRVPMPLAWSVTPLNASESQQAQELIPTLRDGGYLLGDSNYDSNSLHEVAGEHGLQLLAPRRNPGKGLGHRRHSPRRLRCVDLLEWAPNRFGRSLYSRRRDIERQFGGLVSFGGGLQSLPPWVRRLHRVQLFVHAKLIINASRLRRRRA